MELPHPLAPLTLGQWTLVDQRTLTRRQRDRVAILGQKALSEHVTAIGRADALCHPHDDPSDRVDRKLMLREHWRRARAAGRRVTLADFRAEFRASHPRPTFEDWEIDPDLYSVSFAALRRGNLLGSLTLFNGRRVTSGYSFMVIPAFPAGPNLSFEGRLGPLLTHLIGATFTDEHGGVFPIHQLRFPLQNPGHLWPGTRNIPNSEYLDALADANHIRVRTEEIDGVAYLSRITHDPPASASGTRTRAR